jgi:hypothetical protein
MNNGKIELKNIDETRDYIDKLIQDMSKDTYNFLLLYSGRGIGKTYTLQKRLIREAINNNFEIGFVVLKAKEIEKKALWGWIEKVWAKEFDEQYEVKITKQEIFYKDRKYGEEWIRLLYIFSICESDEYKIMSFPRMRYLIWDECVKEKPRPEDTMAMYRFINIYETVDREQNELKAICMCNVLKTAKVSPVFDYFHVPSSVLVNEYQNINGRFSVYLPTFIENKDFAKGVLGYEGMTNGEFETFNIINVLKTPNINEYMTSSPIIIKCDSYFYFILFTNSYTYIELLKFDNYIDLILDDTEKNYTQYTTSLWQVTDNMILIPQQLIDYLRRMLCFGKLKFCTEETLLRQTEFLKLLKIE